MFKKILVFFVVILMAFNLEAQLISRNKIKVSEASIYGNFGLYDQPSWGVGANIQYLWGVGRGNQRFKIGAGLREYSMFLKDREMQTSNQDFVKYLLNGPDSVFVQELNLNLLNVHLAMMYNIKRGIDFGVNVDLGGVTFGPNKEGFFHSYEITKTDKQKVDVKAYPFNLNKGMGKNNVGNIYSEAYFQFRASRVVRFRAGLNFIVSEIKTSYPVTANGNRFRNANYLMTLGIAINVRDGENAQHFR